MESTFSFFFVYFHFNIHTVFPRLILLRYYYFGQKNEGQKPANIATVEGALLLSSAAAILLT